MLRWAKPDLTAVDADQALVPPNDLVRKQRSLLYHVAITQLSV